MHNQQRLTITHCTWQTQSQMNFMVYCSFLSSILTHDMTPSHQFQIPRCSLDSFILPCQIESFTKRHSKNMVVMVLDHGILSLNTSIVISDFLFIIILLKVYLGILGRIRICIHLWSLKFSNSPDCHQLSIALHCRIVALQSRIVALQCRIVALQCRIVALQCRIVALQCRIVALQCRIVALQCRIVCSVFCSWSHSHSTSFHSIWYPLPVLLGGQSGYGFKACPRLLHMTRATGIKPYTPWFQVQYLNYSATCVNL